MRKIILLFLLSSLVSCSQEFEDQSIVTHPKEPKASWIGQLDYVMNGEGRNILNTNGLTLMTYSIKERTRSVSLAGLYGPETLMPIYDSVNVFTLKRITETNRSSMFKRSDLFMNNNEDGF